VISGIADEEKPEETGKKRGEHVERGQQKSR